MIARLQQFLVLGGLLATAAWGAFWWSRSPVLAFAGIVAMALAQSAVLAIEFIASRAVNSNAGHPRASVRRYLGAWWAESLLAARVFGWQQPFRAHVAADHVVPQARRGVVLVHGFMCNRGFWLSWTRALRADDRVFVAVDLEPALASIDAYIQTLDDAILRVTEATRQPPLLVCHSMGGLVARAWLDATVGSDRVHHIVTIGTPHAGTWLARFGRGANARQMRLGSDWLRRLNAGPVHQPRAAFTCWYSDCDNIVFPLECATLPGADNRLVTGCGHVQLAFEATVQRETLALLQSPT